MNPFIFTQVLLEFTNIFIPDSVVKFIFTTFARK